MQICANLNAMKKAKKIKLMTFYANGKKKDATTNRPDRKHQNPTFMKPKQSIDILAIPIF